MSYDVFVQDLPPGLRHIDELPEGFVAHSLGPRARIVDAIRRVAPSASVDLPWMVIDGPGYSIEVNLGDADPVDGFAFHVRGGEVALSIVARILADLGLQALAPESESGLFTPPKGDL